MQMRACCQRAEVVDPVVITGTSSGIGRATAQLLLSSGVLVAGIDRDPAPDTWPELTPDLRQNFLPVIADLTDPAQVHRAVSDVTRALPEIGGLVNCAGIYPVTPMLEMSVSEWDDVLSINLKAPFLMTQAMARHWQQNARGCKVVNVASTAAYLARPGTAHYAASKAGLIQLTKVMAIELAPLGIQVNAVAPGLIGTERVMAHATGAGSAEHQAKLARIPARREGQPTEVARTIRWLLSSDTDYATGAVLTLDGGFSLGIPSY